MSLVAFIVVVIVIVVAVAVAVVRTVIAFRIGLVHSFVRSLLSVACLG